MASNPSIKIRLPHEEEVGLIDRRFPLLLTEKNPPNLFVAETANNPGILAGWLGLKYLPSIQNPQKAIFIFFVNRNIRRQGVGTALIKKAIEVARETGAEQLTHMRPILGGSSAEKFMLAQGFALDSQFTSYEMKTAKLTEVVTPLYEKLLAHKKFSESKNLFLLKDVSFTHEVKEVILNNLGDGAPWLRKRIEEDFEQFSPDISPVVIDEGRILGASLVVPHSSHATVEANIVDKEYRNSWVNIALKHRLAQAILDAGYENIRLGTHSTFNSDTRKLLKKTDAQLLVTQCHYIYTL